MELLRRSAERIVTELDDYHNDLVGRSAQDIIDLGIPLVPEGRRLIPSRSEVLPRAIIPLKRPTGNVL